MLACFPSALMAETTTVLGFERAKFGFKVENPTTWKKARWGMDELREMEGLLRVLNGVE